MNFSIACHIKEKYQRLKCHKKLCETEEMLCKRLALPKHDAGVNGVPTREQLNEIEENIKYMENELVIMFNINNYCLSKDEKICFYI